jgi:kynurenine formamidase
MSGLDAVLKRLSDAQCLELEHERYIGAPIFSAHWPGFIYTMHRHHESIGGGQRTSASGTITMQEHSGTHIDALNHQAVDMVMYGGVRVTPEVQTARGINHLGAQSIDPILRRGVLLDVAAARGVDALSSGHLVSDDDLAAAVEAQRVSLQRGDCVLIRTGNGALYDDPELYLRGPGIGPDAARWLAAHEPWLCGADNVAFDVPDNDDPELGTLPCHTILIVEAGIYIVENLALEQLAQTGCSEFLFICLPMKLRGVTGSPVRPVALVFE